MNRFTSLLSIPLLAAYLAVPPTSHRAGASTFREEDRGLSVFADGYPASLAADDEFVDKVGPDESRGAGDETIH